MSGEDDRSSAASAKRRVEDGLEALRAGLAPYVEKHMHDRYGEDWRSYTSRAEQDGAAGPLDVQALLKTLLGNWNELFRQDGRLRKARSFISLAIDARNAAAHFAGEMEAYEALRHLDAMRALLAAIGASNGEKAVAALYDEQIKADDRIETIPRDVASDEPPPQPRHGDIPAADCPDVDSVTAPTPVDRNPSEQEYVGPAGFSPTPPSAEGARRTHRGPPSGEAPRGKYVPLYRHLVACSDNEWHASFAEVEAILGPPLPPSARRHNAWWANGGHSQANAWLAAGWRTRSVDRWAETLVFERMS